MNIRLSYTLPNGRDGMQFVDLPAIPDVGVVITDYPARPSANRPQTPNWQLRVVGKPEFHVIGRAVDVIVPCESVDSGKD